MFQRRYPVRRHLDITDIGKALGAQQLLGDVLRRRASAAVLIDPHRRRFEDAFGGRSLRETRGAGRSQGGQEMASSRNDRQRKSFPVQLTPSTRVSAR
jgi:hypothetical protein